MQNYIVELESVASNSFLAKKAAQSVDLDINQKLKHKLEVTADINDFKIGMIVGASGSGKTTLAKQIFGNFKEFAADPQKAIIDQFPEDLTFDQIASLLCGMGLAQIPCWIKPLATLSNGQQYRAKAALEFAHAQNIIVLDEWTSVVDRTVATAMSRSLKKMASRQNKQIIIISCHYDIIADIEPDWLIDCNEQKFELKPQLEKKNCNSRSEKSTKKHGNNLVNITI